MPQNVPRMGQRDYNFLSCSFTENPANLWLAGLLGCLNKKDILRKLCGFKGKEEALPLWQLLQPDLPFIYCLGLVNNEDIIISKSILKKALFVNPGCILPGTFCNHVWNSSAKLMINAVPASLFDLGRNKRNTGRFHYTLVCPLKLHPEPPLFSVIHLLCCTCAIGGSLAKQLRFSVKKAGQPMVDRFAGMAFPKNVYLCCRNPGITLYLNHTGSYKIFRLEL